MGNDGGTIPSRTEILNFSLKKLKGTGAAAGGSNGSGGVLDRERATSQMLNTFRYCRLSKETLAKPVVSDFKGFLYNKEKVLQYLLDSKRGEGKGRPPAGEDLPNFESLNDVVQLNIALEGDKLTCPLSNVTLDISKDGDIKLSDVQFSYIVPCGCTMNAKILGELVGTSEDASSEKSTPDQDTSKKCPVCSTTFTVSDIIDINPQDEQSKKRLVLRMQKLKKRGLYHNLKRRKLKKCKRSRDVEEKKRKGKQEANGDEELRHKRPKSSEVNS